MKAAKRAAIESRLDRLGEELAEMKADRATFIRHQQTLARHMRRILNDNKQLRIENHKLATAAEPWSRYLNSTVMAR